MSAPIPDELTPDEHQMLVSALITLQTQCEMSIKSGAYSATTMQHMEADAAKAAALREKLRLHYLVPFPRFQ
jgi:hypothetical protein